MQGIFLMELIRLNIEILILDIKGSHRKYLKKHTQTYIGETLNQSVVVVVILPFSISIPEYTVHQEV